jgi:hypothetical protein
MTRSAIFTIHSSRDDENYETHRISPGCRGRQARHLDELGWRITDRIGRQFKPADFDMPFDCNQSARLSLSLHQAG